MNRFRHIPNIFKPNVVVDYLPETQHDETRIVDDSHYVPNRRANQILAKQFAANMLDQLAYDNPEDIRRGAVNVYARQKGRDIAELTQQMRSLEQEVTAEVNKVIKDKMRQAEAQAQAKAQAQAQTQNQGADI